jgi:hypothetical protein
MNETSFILAAQRNDTPNSLLFLDSWILGLEFSGTWITSLFFAFYTGQGVL